MTIHPCVYPNCRDHEGNPRLTTQTICDYSRNTYRRRLTELADDFITIATTMPQPISSDINTRRGKQGTPGHPRAWASDMLRTIAGTLDGIEDGLRDHLGHTPPAPLGTVREAHIVARAYTYLTAQFEQLCTYPGAEASASSVADLAGQIHRALGRNKEVRRLPTPCPECGLTTLVRTIDRNLVDSITCDNCGRTINEDHYGLYARMVLDDLIALADTPDTATV